ncbi:MAG: UDP-N-acetylmuramoyl-L-alanyl-D-glutamate--2,6-diaminopimelate ligase [Gammaproteobacteria bacterium]|nr:UDP-N-acetylmuramoyl-L-alanyl-D-glutamate--2,6-diaminopimelate ligase [Pseudomonadales bacterium]MCP5345559.1 UDP-N-acetylmuramoyl-L-alanyl-D-glutamate--2,6-diaminopimelate ligase [Pseudomonadales bacterium]
MNTAEDVMGRIQLGQLIAGLVELPQPLPQELMVQVSGVKMDSRKLQPGDLFIACFGRNHDAREFVGYALAAGASAVLVEAGGKWQGLQIHEGKPVIAVDNLAARISEIAGRYFGNPSASLKVIGITGTNGKTSCSQFIAQALEAVGIQSGVIGTLGYGQIGQLRETSLTTPDAVFTQRALAELLRGGARAIAMEVSSVGLHQNRVKAVHFDTAVFTNLSRDHLDYHESMENYAENKRKLFTSPGLQAAIINLDDSYGLYMMDAVSRDVRIYTYSLNNHTATVHAKSIELDRHGFRATVVTPHGEGEISCPLFGNFNISNVLAVIAALLSYHERMGNVNLKQLLTVVSSLKPINGRMEIVGSSDELTCLVDYAHTPDGLKSALLAIRDHFDGEVWCVFGCGGNRDRGKRPMMGEIARAYAGKLVITDDNPRLESGEDIVSHILSGIECATDVEVIRDRAEAIDHAVESAQTGDIVLIAGKGHENYQDVAGRKTVFSDASQVRLALQKRAQRKKSGNLQ